MDPAGERSGEIVRERAVEQLERLWRVGARFASGATGLEGRRVERFHERQPQVALGDEVDRPSIMVACRFIDLPLRGFVEQIHQLGVHRHHDARAGHREVQSTRDGQHGVADFLGREPAPAEMPEQSVLRVAPLGVNGDRRADRLAVGVAEHDHPVERLEPPTVPHEGRGQSVEQLGMAGPVSMGAEVVQCLHQPDTEVMGPDPVDDDPRGQRVFGRGEPAGQPGPRVLHVGWQFRLDRGNQNAERPGADRFSLILPDASLQDVNSGPLLRVVLRRRDHGRGGGHRVIKRLDLVGESLFLLRTRRSHLPLEPSDRGLDLSRFRLPGLQLGLGGQADVVLICRREVSLELVVIFLTDRFQLVVVAAGAADRQSEERRANDIGAFGQDLVAAQRDLRVPRVPAHGTQAVENRGGLAFGIVRPDLVAGDLLGEEAIKRLVAIQAGDYVVPKPPGVGDRPIVLVALSLGVANHVKPVLPPSLTVPGVAKEPVDDPLIRIDRRVMLVGLNFLGRRR